MYKIIYKLLLTSLLFVILSNQATYANLSLNNSNADPNDTCAAGFFYYNHGDGLFTFTHDSSSIVNGVYFLWDFGDGGSSNIRNPTHKFLSGIIKSTVSLTVTDSFNNSCTRNIGLQVRPDTSVLITCNADFRIDTVVGDPYSLILTDVSPVTDPIAWRYWTVPDSANYTDSVFYHTFDSTLINTNICLNIVTISGCRASICKYVSFKNICNYVNVGYNSDSNGTVQFHPESSISSIIGWHWQFGDGDTSNLISPVHTYAAGINEVYVSLTITTVAGNTCTKGIFVYVRPLPPCKANFSYSSNMAGTVNFYNQSSADSAANMFWSFGDGTYSYELNPVHYYSSNVTYAYVCLNYKFNSDTCTKCDYIQVRNYIDSCSANFSYNQFGSGKGALYRFTDVSTPSGNIIWRRWTFPDSTQYTDSVIIHSFNSSLKSTEVCLSISTYSGCQSTICKTILLKDTVPTYSCKANFTYTVALDSIGSTNLPKNRVYFTDLSNSSDSSIVFRQWTFGDGTNSTTLNPSHLYKFTKDTSISVGLFMRSLSGCTDSIYQNIFIPVIKGQFSLSGKVSGKNELLSQGVIILYKKADNGIFTIEDANVINNGVFRFENVNRGKYILYATPHMYLSNKYLPTYYVNKLHWEDAHVLNLTGNIAGLNLQMVSAKKIDKGVCIISGIVNNNDTSATKSTKLKSSLVGISLPVYLYTQSGEAIAMTMTDSNNAFEFSELPFGIYKLKIEYMNVTNNETTVSLNPENPKVSGIVFFIENNTLSVKNLMPVFEFSIRNVSDDKIAIRINQEGIFNVAVISLSGKVIVNKKARFERNSDMEIATGKLPLGIYVVQLQSGTGIITKKILK